MIFLQSLSATWYSGEVGGDVEGGRVVSVLDEFVALLMWVYALFLQRRLWLLEPILRSKWGVVRCGVLIAWLKTK